MPSKFSTDLQDGLAALYDEFGVPATYVSPKGETTSNLAVRLHPEDVRSVPGQVKNSGQLQTGRLTVLASALPRPVKDGRFTINETKEVWTLETTPKLKNGQHYCTVKREGGEVRMPQRAENA